MVTLSKKFRLSGQRMTTVSEERNLGNRGKAYTHIKRAIIEQSILPGALVDCSEIAEKVAEPMAAVANVANALVLEDWLVESVDGRFYVKPVTRRDLEEITELRLAIEPLVVERIMPRLSRKQFKYIDALIAQHKQLITSDNPTGRFPGVDYSFHMYLASLTDNNRLIRCMQSVMDVSLRLGAAYGRSPDTSAAVLKDHGTLVNALRRADCAAAKYVVMIHIERGYDLLAAALPPDGAETKK